MLKLKIVTPEGPLYESEEVDSLTIPTGDGIITVYEGHMHIMSTLVPGELSITKGDHSIEMVISSGMLQIKGGVYVNMMVETAERVEEIDIERAKEAHRRAEEFMEQQEFVENKDFIKAQARIMKELARINAATNFRKTRSPKIDSN